VTVLYVFFFGFLGYRCFDGEIKLYIILHAIPGAKKFCLDRSSGARSPNTVTTTAG